MSDARIAIVSGGMDSGTLLAALRAENPDDTLIAVSFNYGQRHSKELDYAPRLAWHYDAEHVLVDLTALRPLLGGSALTDDSIPVPHGHYAAPNMALTVVPNRNAIMLACATGIAVARGCVEVATGVHAGDHPIYPDCRPDFIDFMDKAMALATDGYAVPGFKITAPFVHMTKADIAALGHTLGVEYDLTWSCYEGGTLHCGECGTCVERHEAFVLAGLPDPTVYANDLNDNAHEHDLGGEA